jgi:hypothetical protein
MRELHNNPHQDLFDVQKKHGLEAANLFFYRRTLGTQKCKAFRRIIDEQAGDFSLNNHDMTFLIVSTSVGSREKQRAYSEQQWEEMATDAGFKEIVKFNPQVNSLLDGALQLKKQFQQLTAHKKKVIVASCSHASGFVRFAIDQTPSDELKAIMAWLNVSGVVFGSPRYHCSDKKNFLSLRQNDELRSFSCEQKYFIRPISDKVPAIVSFIGVRGRQSMTAKERKDFFALKHWGPNDGYITFRDYEKMPGFVVPLWGQPHHMNLLNDRKIFQKTMCYLVDICKENADKKWKLADLNFVTAEKQHELQLL